MLTTAVVALSPVIAPADQVHRKANLVHPNNMVQQRALVQKQAVNRGIGISPGTTLRYGGGVGVGRHPGVGMAQHRNQATGPIVASLHSVVAELHQADHDYQGHRVKAITHLDQAIRTIQAGSSGIGTGVGGNNTHLGGRGGNVGGFGRTNNGPRMPQAQSDMHLRQAHQQLLAIESRMNGGPNHHQQARFHVERAVQELNLALAAR